MTAPFAPLSGLRDLPPPDAEQRRVLCRTIHEVFEAAGYELATLSLIERESVLLRGLAGVDKQNILRFVDPESGEVAVLRPDITPQIARLVATELSDRPAPHRLRYEGTVFRRRSTRARTHRQLAQAGIECLGVAAPDGDAEVITLASRTLQRLGLPACIELRCPRLLDDVWTKLDGPLRSGVEGALQRKDRSELAALLKNAPLTPDEKEAVGELPRRYGPAEKVLASFDAAPFGPAATRQVEELQQICAIVRGAEPDLELKLDLGETRGRKYYTGVSFQLLAPGPGEPIGRGGRYDELVGAYGAPMPATGFALMLDPLAWSLREQQRDRQQVLE